MFAGSYKHSLSLIYNVSRCCVFLIGLGVLCAADSLYSVFYRPALNVMMLASYSSDRDV